VLWGVNLAQMSVDIVMPYMSFTKNKWPIFQTIVRAIVCKFWYHIPYHVPTFDICVLGHQFSLFNFYFVLE